MGPIGTARAFWCVLLNALVVWPAWAAAAMSVCPVRIVEKWLTLSEQPQLTVENISDASPLAGYYLQVSWRDGADGAELGGETLALPAVPPKGRAPLALRMRDDYRQDASHLRITVKDRLHRMVGEYALPVHSQSVPSMPSRREPPRRVQMAEQWRLSGNGSTFTLDRSTGQLIALAHGAGLINVFGPNLDVGEAAADASGMLRLGAPEACRCALQQTIFNSDEVGGIWRVESIYRGSGWPTYRRFVSAYRIVVDSEGRLTLHYTHSFLGREGGRLSRWGTALGVRAPRRLVYHGQDPLPGVYELPLVPNQIVSNRPETVAVLAGVSSEEGLIVIPDRPAGLSVHVDAQGRALLGLAPSGDGPVVPREIRTATGALRLAFAGDHWWKTPPPSDWPECDDGDAWPTAMELARGTSPFLSDTDDDGRIDSDDADPLDPDVPARRMPDTEEMAAIAGPPRRGEGWMWVEAEDSVLRRGTAISKEFPAQTSHSACLAGWRRDGDLAGFAFRLGEALADARLALRYARGATEPARWSLRFSHPAGEREEKIELAPTGGWGSQPENWALVEVKVGDVPSGVLFLDLAADGSNAGVNLDGFYLVDRNGRVGSALAGNEAAPPQ